jgi:hypothetical protein
MDFLVPKYRRNPNAKVESLYSGVASGNRTVTTLVKPSLDANRMEATRVYGPGLPRGSGGRIAVLVLGGMETTLDEMEYIIEAKRSKKFIPQRGPGEIASMARLLFARRNEQIEARQKYLKANPSEMPKKKRTVTLHLPVGFRYMPTNEPGVRILARI